MTGTPITVLSRHGWYRADIEAGDDGVRVRLLRRMGRFNLKPDAACDNSFTSSSPYKHVAKPVVIDDLPHHIVLDQAQDLVNRLEHIEFHYGS